MDNEDLEQKIAIRDNREAETVVKEDIFAGMYLLKQEIIGLSATGIAISKLDCISNDISGLLSSDYFTVSQPHAVNAVRTGQKSSEFNVRYGVLREKLLKDFKFREHCGETKEMLGSWMFGTMNKSRIRMDSSKIAECNRIKGFNINDEFPSFDAGPFQNNYSAITLAFFRNRILPIIDRLSSIYYNKNDSKFTYPTRRGDIETILKRGIGTTPPTKIYTASWSNITDRDRLIIGEGSCSDNNYLRYGNCYAGDMDKYTAGQPAGHKDGEDKVMIKTEHYPAHTHKIECSQVSYHMEFHLRGTGAELCCSGVKNNYHYDGAGGLGRCQGTIGTITPFRMTGSVTFSTKAEYGSSIRIHDDIYNSSGSKVNANKNSSHNNIPPVIMVKMIRRVG